MASTVMGIVTSIEAQGLNSIVAGFSFASALAWYGVVKSVIDTYIKTGTSIQAHVIGALLTTLVGVIVFMIMKMFVKNVDIKTPGDAVYAVTR